MLRLHSEQHTSSSQQDRRLCRLSPPHAVCHPLVELLRGLGTRSVQVPICCRRAAAAAQRAAEPRNSPLLTGLGNPFSHGHLSEAAGFFRAGSTVSPITCLLSASILQPALLISTRRKRPPGPQG